MSIAGPSQLTATDALSLRHKLVAQTWKVTGSNRGLHSVVVQLARVQNVYSPEVIRNTEFTTDPFLSSDPQGWWTFGRTTPAWNAAGYVDLTVTAPGSQMALTAEMRTQLKDADNAPLSLPIGTELQISIDLEHPTGSSGNFPVILTAYDAALTETFTTTFNVPRPSARATYTATYTLTKDWNEAWIKIATGVGGGLGPVRVHSVSVKYRHTIDDLVRCGVYETVDGLPTNRIAQSTTTVLPNTGLSNLPQERTFIFDDQTVLLEKDKTYAFVLLADQEFAANWIDDLSTLNVFVIGDTAGSGYADGSLLTRNTGGDWTVDADGDLYFRIFYTDVVPSVSNQIPIISPTWPSDCIQQIAVMDGLVETLDTYLETWQDSHRPMLTAAAGSQPGIGYWQSLWLKQGNNLPLPDGLQILWQDSEQSRFGGEFTYFNDRLIRAEQMVEVPLQVWPSSGLFNTGYMGNTSQPISGTAYLDFSISVKQKSWFRLSTILANFGTAATSRLVYYVNGTMPITTLPIVGQALPAGDNIKIAPPMYGMDWLFPTILPPGSHNILIVPYATVTGVGFPSMGVIPYSSGAGVGQPRVGAAITSFVHYELVRAE